MTLGWTLIHFFWQGAALAAALFLVLMATRSPRWRYGAACLILAAMALAPVLTYRFLGLPGATRDLGPLPVALGAGDALSRAVAGTEPQHWVAWLPMFWLAGVVALSARLILAAWSVHRLTHRWAVPMEDCWPYLRERLGLRRGVRFLTADRLAGPAQAGFLKPVILLPAGLLLQLPAAQLEAIVAHELAHIKRHDYLVNLLQSVVETLLFYHPGVWWVSHVIRAERELCCDEMAAAATGSARQYAEALLALEQVSAGGFSLANTATGGDLRGRVARLLGQPGRPVKLHLPAVLVTLLLAGAVLIPAFGTAQEPVALPPDNAAQQEEIRRLNRQLDALKADTAARIQQQSNAAQLSALDAQRLARTEAQRSLERLGEAQAELIRAQSVAEEAAQVLTEERPLMQARLAELRAAMQVASQAESRTAYDRWLHEDVVYIISEDEVRRFRELKSDPEREEFIKQFWARRDSNPATEENEAKEEHYRRIAYANNRFATGNDAGWKTPRGRLYIVSGPPDEIEVHPEQRREKWLYRDPRAIYEFKR